MRNISQELIKELSYKSSINDNVSIIIEDLKSCIEEVLIKKNVPVSSKTSKIEILNEFATECFTPESKLEIAVILNAGQIELNTIKTNKNKIKKFFKDFISIWKYNIKNKKRKKKDKITNKENPKIKNYTFFDLIRNLQEGLAEYFTEKTIIYNINEKLYIDSREELGIDIIIYLAQNNGNTFKIYKGSKFTEIDFNRRFINLTYKSVETNRKIYSIARIINSLYVAVNEVNLNQILLESCLYNCPNDFFKSEDIYCNFKQILSFLNSSELINFKSIINTNINILEEKYIKNSDIESFKKFLKQVKNLL